MPLLIFLFFPKMMIGLALVAFVAFGEVVKIALLGLAAIGGLFLASLPVTLPVLLVWGITQRLVARRRRGQQARRATAFFADVKASGARKSDRVDFMG